MRLHMLKLSVGKDRQVIKQLCHRVVQYRALVSHSDHNFCGLLECCGEVILSIISIPSLYDNKIGSEGGVALSKALRGMTNLQHLK